MKKTVPSISVIGLGYVGLCTAATFAARGFRVVGIDSDENRVRAIGSAKAPFQEPQLDGLVRKSVQNGTLEVSGDVSAISRTNVTFLAVGTPSLDNGSIDVRFVKEATRASGRAIRNKESYHLVVVKSTVVPGTTSNVVKPLLEQSSGKTVGNSLGLCVNPEFLREGTAVDDSLHPDIIVIGTTDKKSARTLSALITKFHGKNVPHIKVTSTETAELVKYASNAFLASRVSLINTIANIAQLTPNVNVGTVADAIGRIPRIGPSFLQAGPGYGGSCFHKDLQALINYSRERGYDPVLLSAAEEANEKQALNVVGMAEKLLGSLSDKRIAVLGLAFKKDTDDIREAASTRVINQLTKKGARVVAYDPMAMPNTKKQLGDLIEYSDSAHSALKGADCAVIMTEWEEFRKLKPKDFQAYMKAPRVLDARRIYDPKEFRELDYAAIGLGPGNPQQD